MIKANTLEPFIEVDNALNKLKMDDLVQEILDDVGEYERSGAGGTRSSPATPHRLQRRTACNTSPPTLSKMADGVRE